MDHFYIVEGKWPFPTDMLRYDQSQAATQVDQEAIDTLSADHAPEGYDFRHRKVITLVIRDAARHHRPCVRRWESFGWSVPENEEELRFTKEQEKRQRMENLFVSAMAKLTPSERVAVNWCRPPFRG